MKKTVLSIFLFCCFCHYANGQVLISLIFGDKLNSDKIEFGLEGGLVNSNIGEIDNAKRSNGFNLGFYFDFKLTEKSYIHTGVIVKSPLGTKNISPYSLGNENLDILLQEASIKRKLRYFNVPALFKYKLHKQFFIEGGVQTGLLVKAFDEFSASVQKEDDLVFKNDIKDEITTLDFGLVAGLGYRLIKGNGITIGVRYYGGLVDIQKNINGMQQNNAFYFYAGIPIGVKKAQKNNTKKKSEL
ncbi:porin family protein [Mesonia aquimarina]|uniref:porin family protein n=1 Tax=Mesonia aquimarina TaxID=1504967 RepID=UPI000EF56A58|nr:porin family protein [Mesonia aquimarina]